MFEGVSIQERLQIAIYGDFEEQTHPRKEEIITLLECGCANIVTISQALVIGVHFVITKASRPASDPKIKQLNEAGLCIVAPSFVIEWVAHPWQTPVKVASSGASVLMQLEEETFHSTVAMVNTLSLSCVICRLTMCCYSLTPSAMQLYQVLIVALKARRFHPYSFLHMKHVRFKGNSSGCSMSRK